MDFQSNGSSGFEFSLPGWKWIETGQYFSFSILLLITIIIKIIYFKNRKVLNNIPESCALILLGIIVGLLIVTLDPKSNHIPEFTPSLFNFILLPPIVLDSSYELYHQSFFGNTGTIIMFAVVGTMMNIILVSYLIYFSQMISLFGNLIVPTVEIFIFSVIVSAVDPVAVLSVFQEVNVNKALYFLVFGESLLNDAVVITLYDNLRTIKSSPSKYLLIVYGLLSFLISTFGGICIGIFWGTLTCLLTQLTGDRKLKAVEPLIVIVLAYLSYLTGYLFNFSAIISLMTCGLFQAEYANHNISRKSKTTVKYLTKLFSSVTETIIFLFLGLVLVNTDYVWNTSFVIFSTFYCIIARFVTIFALTYIVNVYFQRIRIVNLEEQVLMAYGGLRGAIAFSLSDNLLQPHSDSETLATTHHRLITTTTLFIILFTIFVLGSTTKPLVKMLRVQLQTKGESEYLYEVHNRVARMLMQGIEVIAAQQSTLHFLKRIVSLMNEKFLKKFLLRKFNQEKSLLSKQDSSGFSSGYRSYDSQKLDTPEKDVYPDLNKPIRQFEAFDHKGTLLFPKLDQTLDTFEPEESLLQVYDITRVFTIPKEACSLINSWIVKEQPTKEIQRKSVIKSAEAKSKVTKSTIAKSTTAKSAIGSPSRIAKSKATIRLTSLKSAVKSTQRKLKKSKYNSKR